MVKTVLLLGGSGFLGTHLAMKLREGYKVFATYNSHPMQMPGVTYLPLKLHDEDWVKRMIYTAVPDIVIYAAGSNKLNWAYDNPREAERTNVGGPAAVLKAAIIFQPRFIYLSSCYVFDGNRGNYHENDIVLANSTLGKYKIAGENFIHGRSSHYTVMRLAPVFGRGNGGSPSYLDELRLKLDRKQRVEANPCEFHSFLSIDSFLELMMRLVDNSPRNKTLHFGGLTKMSHYDFARTFAKRFKYDTNLIIEKRPPALSASVEAPSVDYSLNCTEIVKTLKIKPLLLEEGFDLLEKQLIASP